MEDSHNMPTCVGFIMDGNRRWAKAHDLSTHEGHMRGYEALKKIIDAVYKAHIPHMVCYAFSTENWKRSEEEVAGLMGLFQYAIRDAEKEHNKTGKHIRFRFIGEREKFAPELQSEMNRMESDTTPKPMLTVWIALSYGGRAEILQAVNKAIETGEKVSEETFETLLWTRGMPDPDLIIRTSGEERISNFLLWQCAYSEFFFTKTLWPDFGEAEFKSILDEYGNRKRRRGA